MRLPFPSNIQPEDYLTSFLQSDIALEKMKELAPWAINPETGTAIYPPQEVHAVLAWAVNTLLNKEIVSFSSETPFDKIIETIDRRGGVVLSGLFPLKNRSLHHMVSLAGYMKYQNRISYLLIDDPYGDFKSNYRSHRGNNIPVPIDEALSILKPVSSNKLKWAHLIQRS